MQIYDIDLIPLLVSTIRDLFDHCGIKEFILSATLRNLETFQSFLRACGWDTLFLGFRACFTIPSPTGATLNHANSS
jgi:hypothetical protein